MLARLYSFCYLLLIAVLCFGCSSGSKENSTTPPLPILGERYVEEGQDTVFHTIADFSLLNQMGDTLHRADMLGKVYVADFFFTSCPTICPVMKKEMLRVYEQFKTSPDFRILSHSIDPKHDTVEVLKDYAEKLGVLDAGTWHFLTGDQEQLFELGQTSYLTTAMENQQEPGGFLHSGAFLLVDQQGRIRGVYDGTKSDQVDRLLADIPKLLKP